MLTCCRRKSVLFISNLPTLGCPDGIMKYQTELAKVNKEKYDFFVLFPLGKHGLPHLTKFEENCFKKARIDALSNKFVFTIQSLQCLLNPIVENLVCVHFNRFHCWKQSILLILYEYLKQSQIKIVITIHDITCIYDTTCGFPHGQKLKENVSTILLDEKRKEIYQDILNLSFKIVCPSLFIANLMRKTYGNVEKVSVIPHEIIVRERVSRSQIGSDFSSINIAFCGSFVKHKGSTIFGKTATLCNTNDASRLIFHVFGNVIDQEIYLETKNIIKYHGIYDSDSSLAITLKKEQISVVWFPATTPEAYCYALSAVMKSEIAIIASSIGAFKERLNTEELVDLETQEDAEFWTNFWSNYNAEKQSTYKIVSIDAITSFRIYDNI